MSDRNITRIAMWSGPRNISTAMMRSFENREDTLVIDEPFYAYYLNKTGLNHPLRKKVLESQSINWNEIVSILNGEIPKEKKITRRTSKIYRKMVPGSPKVGMVKLSRVH